VKDIEDDNDDANEFDEENISIWKSFDESELDSEESDECEWPCIFNSLVFILFSSFIISTWFVLYASLLFFLKIIKTNFLN
jgi:hypothetical protein